MPSLCPKVAGEAKRAEKVPEHGPTVLLSTAWAGGTNSSGLHLSVRCGVALKAAGKIRQCHVYATSHLLIDHLPKASA